MAIRKLSTAFPRWLERIVQSPELVFYPFHFGIAWFNELNRAFYVASASKPILRSETANPFSWIGRIRLADSALHIVECEPDCLARLSLQGLPEIQMNQNGFLL